MTTIQKNVMIVIDAMLFLTWPPRTPAHLPGHGCSKPCLWARRWS